MTIDAYLQQIRCICLSSYIGCIHLFAFVQSFGAFKLKSDADSGSIRTGSLFEKNKPRLDAAAVPATGCFYVNFLVKNFFEARSTVTMVTISAAQCHHFLPVTKLHFFFAMWAQITCKSSICIC